MSEFFITVLNMSISACWIVFAILLLRLILKKAPKWIAVMLWDIAAVRLICPFTVESSISLIPSAEIINSQALSETNTGIPIIGNTVNSVIRESAVTNNSIQQIVRICSEIWIAGISLMLIYSVISYIRIKRKTRTAVLLRDNVFQSENVASPFVFGIVKPKIFLPFKMSGQNMEYVIAHEQAHIIRRDYLWKLIGFLILSLHWFNPIMWLAYVLFCRDIEFACDEKVIKVFNREQKADYAQALLNCSVNRRMISACPLAFGEVGVKERVKSVLNYKKPSFWIVILSVVICVAVAVCFLTDSPADDKNNGVNAETSSINKDSNTEYNTEYDTATFDIDGDGRDEICSMTVGPTSGLFTFMFDVREVGTEKIKYHTLIYSQWYDLSFEKGNDGVTRVKGVTQGEAPETHLFDISAKDDTVSLTENGVPIGEIS